MRSCLRILLQRIEIHAVTGLALQRVDFLVREALRGLVPQRGWLMRPPAAIVAAHGTAPARTVASPSVALNFSRLRPPLDAVAEPFFPP
jgi:hypothetical protein